MSRETEVLLKAFEAVQFHIESLHEKAKYGFSTVTALPVVRAQDRADKILDRLIQAAKFIGAGERVNEFLRSDDGSERRESGA